MRRNLGLDKQKDEEEESRRQGGHRGCGVRQRGDGDRGGSRLITSWISLTRRVRASGIRGFSLIISPTRCSSCSAVFSCRTRVSSSPVAPCWPSPPVSPAFLRGLVRLLLGSFEARFGRACIFQRVVHVLRLRRTCSTGSGSPSLFTLFFSSTISRRATHGRSQSDARSRCSRMSTFVFTLLTFCPPAPPLRANEMVTSSLVTFRGGSVHSPGSGIGRVSATRGPEMPRNVSTSFGPLSFNGVSSKSSSSSYCEDGGREEERDVRGVRWTHRLD